MKATRIALFLVAITTLVCTLPSVPAAYAAEDPPFISTRYIKDLRSAQGFSIDFSRIKQTRDRGYVMVGITDQRSTRDANGNMIGDRL